MVTKRSSVGLGVLARHCEGILKCAYRAGETHAALEPVGPGLPESHWNAIAQCMYSCART